MNTVDKNTSSRILPMIFALILAFCLALPAHAKDIELEPDAYAGGTVSTVSSTAPTAAGEASATAASVVNEPASVHDDSRDMAPSSDSTIFASFLRWLSSLPFFGG